MRGAQLSGANSRVSVMLAAAVLAMAIWMGAAPNSAQASLGWQSGPLVESQNINCITGDVEREAGSYLSYYFDPSAPPKAGDVYYVAIDVTGIGNTCAGIYADIEMALPSGTSPAVSPQFSSPAWPAIRGGVKMVDDRVVVCRTSRSLWCF